MSRLGGTSDRIRRIAAASAVAALFLSLRIAFVAVRPPFFDELFTRWIASLRPPSMLRALLHDSGPPLYYLVVHALFPAEAAVHSIRLLSLLFAGIAIMVIWLADGRWAARVPGPAEPRIGARAAALLAAFPPAVFAAADARAYALSALAVAIACLALDGWVEAFRAGSVSSRRSLVVGCLALLFAAAAHYYGVLFFAVPAILGAMQRSRRMLLEGVAGSLACGVAYAPGFWLATRQPAAAIRWMGDAVSLAPLSNLGFAASDPSSLMPSAPIGLTLVALATFVVCVLRTPRSTRAMRFGAMTAVPIIVAIAASVAGHRIYFPLRFETIIAPPLVLWIAAALGSWAPAARRVLMAAMLAIGTASCLVAISGYRSAPPDAYRAAAEFVHRSVDPRSTIVTSGYSYLETISQRHPSWRPRVIALPSEQAVHPGWYELVPASALRRDAADLLKAFPELIWVGPPAGPELSALATQARIDPLWSDGVVAVVRVVRR